MAQLQQGLASLQQLGQFLEQKRQFEEDQARLNRVQDANWSWNALQELVKTTDAGSLKDVAAKYPGMLSIIMQKGMGVDSQEAMSWITAMASSPYNAEELFNHARTMINRYGSGEVSGADAIKTQTDQFLKVNAPAPGEKPAEAPKPSVPAPVAGPAPSKPPLVPVVPKPAEIQKAPVEGTAGTPELPLFEQFKNEVRGILSKPNTMEDRINALKILAGTDRYKSDPDVQEFARSGIVPFIQNPGVSTVPATKAAPSTLPPPVALPTPAQVQEMVIPTQRQGPTGKTTPARAAAPVSPEVDTSLTDLMQAISSGSQAQTVVKRKKLERVLSPVVAAQMEANPEGVSTLVENAVAILNDPNLARGMALAQNAPAVLASEQKTQNPAAMAKALLDLQKAGYDTETARLNMIKAGLTAKKDQLDAVMAGITLSMIQGGMLPPDLQRNLVDLTGKSAAEFELANKAKAANDKAGTDIHLKAHNDIEKQINSMLLAYKNALGKQDTPEARKLQALVDAELQYQSGGRALGFLWQRAFSAGKFVQGSAGGEVQTAKPPEMTGGGAALGAEYGLQ